MKITGRIGNRTIEIQGKKIMLDERSYKAGYKAGMKLKAPDCVFDFKGCSTSFAAGYTNAMDSIRGRVDSILP